jgi:hypothetical protein
MSNYGYGNYNQSMETYGGNVTSVEDLHDIEKMEQMEQMASKKMKQSHVPPASSGMVSHLPQQIIRDQGQLPRDQQQPISVQNYPQNMMMSSPYVDMDNESVKEVKANLNCLDVCDHIKTCPICTKFYKNDNTVYIVVIIVLIIISLLLLKNVLDNIKR